MQPGLYIAKDNQGMVHLSTTKHGEEVELQPFENESLVLNPNSKKSKLNISTNHLLSSEEK